MEDEQRLRASVGDRYLIEKEVGRGGMATVYLAEDRKHRRKVALKVLKPDLAAVVGADRFLSEIGTTAKLQHPNILPLYDSGEADSFLYYVMPYVDGESLRDRLDAEKQLPVEEAVGIATAVAKALDFAHQQGVVHRDIKPGNILFQAGQPLVGDFGIALAVGGGAGPRLTETGLSLGTPYYMSPEQATGDRTIGSRSDIYSLGCVLYEMLVGEPPFTGSTAQAVLGKIIAAEPGDAAAQRPAVPPNVNAAIRKALERVPADRFGTAGEMVSALADQSFRHGGASGVGPGASSSPWKIAAVAGAVTTLLALAWAISPTSTSTAPGRRIRLEVPRPWEEVLGLSLAPDGSRLAYLFLDSIPGSDGQEPDTRIWIQGWNGLPPTPVVGSEGAFGHAFSPNGERIAFMVQSGEGSDLRIVELDGSRPRTILENFDAEKLAWGEDGYIYASSRSFHDPFVVRVPEGGGEPEEATSPEAGKRHTDPVPLPRGRGLLFRSSVIGGPADTDSIGALDLESGEQRTLVQGRQVWYSPSSHLVFISGDRLMAAPFELETMELTGEPSVVADGVTALVGSAGGTLVYVEGTPGGFEPELRWIYRDGTEATVGWRFAPGNLPSDPVFSPDGSRLAVRVPEGDSAIVHVRNMEDGTTTRLGPGLRLGFSADGSNLGFVRLVSDSTVRAYRQRSDGSAPPVALSVPIVAVGFGRWSPDEPVVYGTPTGLAVLTPGDTVPEVILDGQGSHLNPTLSPDRRWVAFTTEVAGQHRIFVRPFPDVGSALYPVSLGYGQDAQWSPDGTTLYYTAITDEAREQKDIVAARIGTESGFQVLSRDPVVPFQYGRDWRTGGWLYTMAPDGGRALISQWRFVPGTESGLVLAEDFGAELNARLGGGL